MRPLGEHVSLVVAGAVLLFSLLLGLVARWVLLARLARLAEKTASKKDDAVVASLRRPLPVWFLLGGAYVASHLVQVPPDVGVVLEKALLSVLILSVTLWAANLASRLLQRELPAGGAAAVAATGVVRQAVRIAVLAVGGLVLLGTLGISVTPVLTTVGIGGLAVALGLQETLANLFAGMQITLAGNICVGDFIKLESGEEGYVDDIHWRTTRVRTLPNNFVLIPNSRLAQSVVTNYHRPSKDMAVLVQVGVHYASNLDHVERVTGEVARTIMKTVKGGVPEFEPFIRYHTFADSSIDFTVILRAQELTDSFLVKHEFVKALSRAYAAEGIVIPFPIRAINLDQEKARVERGA
ncbi:MAG: mechanosensitive ion channel family protein [Myxococcota bacterium]